MRCFHIVQMCIKIQDGVGGNLVFWISGFWTWGLLAALMLHTEFRDDQPYGSKVISTFPLKCMGNVFFLAQQDLLVNCEWRFGLYIDSWTRTNQKQKKCHKRMNMSGMRRGKNPPLNIFLHFVSHAFCRNVMTTANFCSNILTGFGDTAVQSYSPPIHKAQSSIELTPTFPLQWG